MLAQTPLNSAGVDTAAIRASRLRVLAARKPAPAEEIRVTHFLNDKPVAD